jgi:hypothetical protein
MSPTPNRPKPCVNVTSDISAPIFFFAGNQYLSALDAYTQDTLTGGMLSLTGPSVTAEAGHLPVRGDLAHIKLAGRYFVPHYAVPMPHSVIARASLRRSGKADADEICELPEGACFDVLDMAGGWAWGQYGEDGPVGYVRLSNLKAS